MKFNVKEIVLSLVLVVVTAIIFTFVFKIGIFVSGKSNVNQVQQTSQQVESNKNNSQSAVSEEKKSDSNIPKAEDNNVSSTTNNKTETKNNAANSEKSNNEQRDKTEKNTAIVAGSEYTVKSGDTIISIAARAYGDNNAGDGVEKIKKENDLKNDNLSVGQTLKIPK